MKRCGSCGNEYLDRFPKCPKCGSTKIYIELERQINCPNCGETNPMRHSNCFNCHKPLWKT